ncbi:MAG: Xaa-Pro dipeptidase [bacterium (Candidatus Stahlbacteria) CG23_combo_of_CG06-09_8_20_14_all_40_9]|nr:MAG: Xaa-Pro dipeptidase [bacterium (Candidatus Stahlbacteria) CG23_combo_of_CG06-09_8_20_14_all_40_9]
MTKRRIDKLREKMGVESLVVTDQTNIRYLTGYRGDNGVLLITEEEATLITDSRYEESSNREVKGAEIVITNDDIFEKLVTLSQFKKIKKTGFERENIRYSTYEKLKQSLKDKELIPVSNLVEELRMKKDEGEIKLIKKACGIGNRVLQEVLKKISLRSTEKDISAEIEFLIKRYGGDKQSFDTIVAAGDNSALPHAIPTGRKIAGENMLLIDMGVFCNDYASDMTRTFLLKEDKKARKMYAVVSEAQKRAIEALKPGVELKEIDRIARDYISDNHYGKNFGHSLGHGVGLSVHELPKVSNKSTYKAEEGMVFSIEPGVYIPGYGGIRIEDLILVTKTGYEVITKSPSASAEVITGL